MKGQNFITVGSTVFGCDYIKPMSHDTLLDIIAWNRDHKNVAYVIRDMDSTNSFFSDKGNIKCYFSWKKKKVILKEWNT